MPLSACSSSSRSGSPGALGEFDGCGNVHFAPHSRFHHDYESAGVTARGVCEHYGLGEGGADRTTLTSHETCRPYNQDPAYRDCGGGWSIDMRQNSLAFKIQPATPTARP